MTEKVSIKGKDVWLVVKSQPVQRDNPRIIPTEYFTVSYHYSDPASPDGESGEIIREQDDSPKLFESPVAALEYVNEALMNNHYKFM